MQNTISGSVILIDIHCKVCFIQICKCPPVGLASAVRPCPPRRRRLFRGGASSHVAPPAPKSNAARPHAYGCLRLRTGARRQGSSWVVPPGRRGALRLHVLLRSPLRPTRRRGFAVSLIWSLLCHTRTIGKYAACTEGALHKTGPVADTQAPLRQVVVAFTARAHSRRSTKTVADGRT